MDLLAPLVAATALSAVPLAELLKPQDLPASLRMTATGQTTLVVPGVPTAPWGLQLCSSGPGGKQVGIPAPATVDTLLLALSTDNSRVLGARLYRYPSEQAAEQAWMRLRAAAPLCSGTVRAEGGWRTTLSNGGTSVIWTENRQIDGNGATDRAALYATFSRHGAVILATNLSKLGTSVISAAEREAVQQVAAGIGAKLTTRP